MTYTYIYHDGLTDVYYKKGETNQHFQYCRDYHSGLLKWITGPEYGETRTHDVRGNVQTVRVVANDSDSYTETHAQYDEFNNVIQRSFGYNHAPTNAWQYTWDTEHQVLTSITDPEGYEIRAEYQDALPVKIRRMVSASESFDVSLNYAQDGLLTDITNANGHAIHLAYDSRGYSTNLLYDTGYSIALTRDALGYPDLVQLPGATGPRTYDLDVNSEGLLERMVYPDNRSMSYAYDAYGNITNHVDEAGRVTTLSYTLGELTKVSRILEGTPNVEASIELGYDQQMERLWVKDPMGRFVEWYILDGQDRIVTVTNEELQTLHFDYSVAGFVTNFARFDGTQVSIAHDSQGFLSRIQYPTLQNQYTFLGNGLLQRAENEAGVISNTYGPAKRLMAVQQPVPNGAMTYAYYPGGQVSNVTYAGISQSRAYDAVRHLTEIREPQGTISMQYSSTNNQMAHMDYPNGIHSEYAYDDTDRKTSIAWRDGANNTRYSLAYSYNAVDLITNIVHASGAETAYTYDSLDRLIREDYRNSSGQVVRTMSYAYDLSGNRLSKTENGQAESYVMGVGNKLSSWGNGSHYLYDAAGNVTQRYYNGTVNMVWNDRYQMSEAHKNGLLAEAYTFDAYGRRVSVSDGQATTYFIYHGHHVAAEVDAAGQLQRSYTYGAGMDNILSMTIHAGGSAQTYYYLKDHLNTVLALTDESGAVVESYEYDAWGNVRVFDASQTELAQSAFGNRYTFQGREISWATGLYYFRARWYDPVTGRWLSKDPIGISGGLNLYAFCANNPVNFVDPFGLEESKSTPEYPFTWTPPASFGATNGPPLLPGQSGSFITPNVYYDGDPKTNKFRPGLGGNSGANTWAGNGGWQGGNKISATIATDTNQSETSWPTMPLVPEFEDNDE